LEWSSLRAGFLDYLDSQNYSSAYKSDLLHYLDENVTSINGPSDVIGVFSRVKRGRRHLWLAMRVLFNYVEVLGLDTQILTMLRRALPKGANRTAPDLKVPSENEVENSLRLLHKAPRKYQVLYNLLLDSGLRLVEAASIVNNFRVENVERVGRFYRIEIGEFRGSKQAFYGYFTERTFKMLAAGTIEPLSHVAASRYYTKMGYVQPKYMRKFAFDSMIRLEVPESVADFIEGRVPKRVGAKHYMALRRQSDHYYGRYARRLEGLRGKLINAVGEI
jgi:intergrase/recombinase